MKAPAKINLFLHINSKLLNNHHQIESMIVFAHEIYDEIEVSDSQELKLVIIGEFAHRLSNTPENIVFKAFDNKKKLQIKLNKNIPVSAGIGGGSSDAAAMIKIIHKDLDEGSIRNLCTEIGADVLCCYYQRPCYIEGTGEKIHFIDTFPKAYVVLVNPLIEILTKDVFNNIKFEDYSEVITKKPATFTDLDSLVEFLKNTNNGMQRSAQTFVPEIKEIIFAINIQEYCLISRMSGSGATCFGLFSKKEYANKAAKNLKKLFPNFWVRVSEIG